MTLESHHRARPFPDAVPRSCCPLQSHLLNQQHIPICASTPLPTKSTYRPCSTCGTNVPSQRFLVQLLSTKSRHINFTLIDGQAVFPPVPQPARNISTPAPSCGQQTARNRIPPQTQAGCESKRRRGGHARGHSVDMGMHSGIAGIAA